MKLAEILDITGDNGGPKVGLLHGAIRMEQAELRDWFEAPYAAYLVYEHICDIHDKEQPGLFAACMDLFSSAFWRRAGWGKFTILDYHDQDTDNVAHREWAKEPMWVVRAASLGWVLKTAPYQGGFIGMVESDDGQMACWFNLEVTA